ncbi:MAG: MarR family transcriptional regulator [Candidatus Eisenbacteria bacterium]
MGIALQKRLLTSKFESPVHEMMINVMLANTFVRMRLDEAFEDTDLTFPQYNLLRILNGAFPNGYSRGEISRRMIDRAPDMTRMIDRLVKRGLVVRERSGEDGRQAITTITPKGRTLVNGVNARVKAVHKVVGEPLTDDEARQLSHLLEKLYGYVEGAQPQPGPEAAE